MPKPRSRTPPPRTAQPKLGAEIARLRRQMDELNAELVELLQQRARLALEIGRAKALRALGAEDPARERAMLRRAVSFAPPGFARRELSHLLRGVFAASRALIVADRGAASGRPDQRRRNTRNTRNSSASDGTRTAKPTIEAPTRKRSTGSGARARSST
ncbi:MAG: hypothetical protein EPO68_00965 [Planctomycetota bacterium]|nr:MAG: hypothetical protein EPO68_00965 [Planctomycetota bacterium]